MKERANQQEKELNLNVFLSNHHFQGTCFSETTSLVKNQIK